MTDAQQALAQVCEALEAMRGDWLGDGFTKLHRSQIVAVLDGQAAEIERLTAERDNARERFELTANLLMSIHALLYPPPVTLPDGRTFVFRPEDPDPHTVLQTLSDRIRALPDEIAAINDAKEQR